MKGTSCKARKVVYYSTAFIALIALIIGCSKGPQEEEVKRQIAGKEVFTSNARIVTRFYSKIQRPGLMSQINMSAVSDKENINIGDVTWFFSDEEDEQMALVEKLKSSGYIMQSDILHPIWTSEVLTVYNAADGGGRPWKEGSGIRRPRCRSSFKGLREGLSARYAASTG